MFLCVCDNLFNADSCYLVLTLTPWSDTLSQKNDNSNQESKVCNTYRALTGKWNLNKLLVGNQNDFLHTMSALRRVGFVTQLARPSTILSAHLFSALSFDVLSFDRLLVWQCRDKAPLHRGDDADSYTKVCVLRSGANRPVLLGRGDCVMGSSKLTDSACFWEDCLHSLSVHSQISLCSCCV